MNVQKASTVAGADAAFRSVSSMNRFSTSMTASNKLDLAAYIQSRK